MAMHARGSVNSAELERLCEVMHDAYETAAAREGWVTQQASRKPWADVPDANKRTMRYAVSVLLEALLECPIDHAAEAKAIVAEGAGGIHNQQMVLAQVHATLALVEQQRIANLVALADHARARFGQYAGEASGIGTLFSYGDTADSNMRLRDDIRAALGLVN